MLALIIMVGLVNQVTAQTDFKVQVLPDGGKKFDNGELHYTEGIPVLKVSGSYYSMGLQYGVLLKDELQEAMVQYNAFKKAKIETLPWYQKLFIGSAMSEMIRDIEAFIPLAYRQELQGIAKGSGLKYDDLVFIADSAGLFNMGCTSVLSNTPDGIIHGRNFDLSPYFLSKYFIIVEYSPEGRDKYTSFGIVGFPGIVQGVNQSGLSVTVNHGSVYKEKRSGMPIGYRVREILDEATSLQEADRIIKRYPNEKPGWMVTIGSNTEKSGVVYDLFDTIIAKSDWNPEKTRYVFNDIFAKDRYPDRSYSQKYSTIDIGEGETNYARKRAAEQFLATNTIKTPADMANFLGNTNFFHYASFTGNFNTIANEKTINTIVFDANNRNVYFAVAPGYSSLSPMFKYDLDTAQITPFKQANPQYEQWQNYLQWLQQVEQLKQNRDYKRIYAITDVTKANLAQFMVLFDLWWQNNNVADRYQLLTAADRLIVSYPDYGVLYAIKGLLQQNDNQYIENAEKALKADILTTNIKIAIYGGLADAYKRQHNKEYMIKNAKLCIALIDELRTEYQADRFEREYKKMREYIRETKEDTAMK